MRRIPDPDDGRRLAVGQSYRGNADFPFGLDWFPIELSEGQRITVTVELVMIDPLLKMDRTGIDSPIEDDDGGGGILGLNAQLAFEAREGGEHTLVVAEADGYATGGYLLDIKAAAPGAYARSFGDQQRAAESSPSPPPSEKLPADPESEREWRKHFAFLPEGWSVDSEFFSHRSGTERALLVGGGRFTGLGYDPNVAVLRFPVPKNTVPGGMTGELIRQMKSRSLRFRIVSRENVAVDSVEGERVEMLIGTERGDMSLIQIYLLRDNELWLIQSACTAANEEAELCAELLQSFRFPEEPLGGKRPLETVMVAGGFAARISELYKSGERQKAEEQVELFSRFADSLGEDDPGYAETPATVGSLDSMLGRYDLAIQSVDRAVAAYSSTGQPEKLASALTSLAWVYYLTGKYAEGEPLGRRASAMDSGVRGPNHSSTVASNQTLAMLLVGLAR